MIRAVKIRLKPNREQENLLWQMAGGARFAYNWAVNKEDQAFLSGEPFIPPYTLASIWRQERPEWALTLNADLFKQAIYDACKAYTNFFRIQKAGPKYTNATLRKAAWHKRPLTHYDLNGHPKFKSRKRGEPGFYNAPEKIRFYDDKVLLTKVGRVRLSEPERVPCGKLYNPRISFDGKYWYVSLACEFEIKPPELTDIVLGVDLGVKTLATVSNGDTYENINKAKKVRKLNKKLRRGQRKASRKYKMNPKKEGGDRYQKSKNIIKQEKKNALINRKIRNIRDNQAHQMTAALVKTKPRAIVVEDLNVRGMMSNRHLSKAVQGCQFNGIRRQLEYKCAERGIQLIIADRYYASSKTCSCCGYVKKDLKLSERVYICAGCGEIIDRDLNAAINLANLA